MLEHCLVGAWIEVIFCLPFKTWSELVHQWEVKGTTKSIFFLLKEN
jgi:hypothetical protein